MNRIKKTKSSRNCQPLFSHVDCFNQFPVIVELVAPLGSVVDTVEEHPDVSGVHVYLVDNLEYLMIEM